jgi:GGDEF domain-containing protein
MRKNLAFIFTIFSVLFFLFIFIFLALKTFRIRETNAELARKQFEDLTAAVTDIWSAEESLDSEPFKSFMKEAYRVYGRMRAFSIYSEDYGTVYFSVRNPAAVEDNDIFNGDVPELEYNKLYQNRSVLPFKMFGTTYVGTGIFNVLTEEDIFPVLTDVLFILAGFAVLTGAVWIISRLGGRENRDEPEPHKHKPAEPEGEALPEAAAGPGLFSPRTGLSNGMYLEKRLTLELERSASNEEDLSLLLINVKGMSSDTAALEEAEQLIDFFKFEDMIFEYSRETFAVILPNINLDEAIAKTEAFLENAEFSGLKRFFGISSRNGRLISGERLLVESGTALKKTDNSSQIIAFRPDPNKYRDYISAKRPGSKARKY